jgi:DNA-binding protein HU-beta
MSERVDRDELVSRVSQRTGQDPETVATIVDTFLDEIYRTIQQWNGVTLKNFGGFYVRPETGSWVFKFNPSQKWRALFGWSSTYKG